MIARGPKSVGALRAHGLRERCRSPPSECFDDVLAYLRGSTLTGRWIVVQEHGRSLSAAANAPCRQGASVETVTVPRCAPDDDQAAMFRMVDLVADRRVDAVTFTSALAVDILLDVAAASRRRGEVVEAFRDGVLATCVGPVTAAPFELYGVLVLQPGRARLAAMVRALEVELPSRRGRTGLDGKPPAAVSTATASASTGGGRAVARAAGGAAGRWPSAPATSCRAASCWATCPAATPGASTRWRSPSDGSVPPSVHVWCRRSSSAATACRSPEEESAVKPRVWSRSPTGHAPPRGR